MWTPKPPSPQRTGSVYSVASMRSNSSQCSSTIYTTAQQGRLPIGSDLDVAVEEVTEDTQVTDGTHGNAPSTEPIIRASFDVTVRETGRNCSSALLTIVPEAGDLYALTAHSDDDDDYDSQSRTSTLKDDSHNEIESLEKTPTPIFKTVDVKPVNILSTPMDRSTTFKLPPNIFPLPTTTQHQPGPLELQFSALMSSIIHLERPSPTLAITPADHANLTAQLANLIAEKETWTRRHSALWRLRDEDIENTIKLRGFFAKACRDLEAMTKLRNDDLANVQDVRTKLAEARRQLDKYKGVQEQQQQLRSPPTHRSSVGVVGNGGRPVSFSTLDRRQTDDLFAMAKAAALEQRALELEKRNSDLVAEMEALKGDGLMSSSSLSARAAAVALVNNNTSSPAAIGVTNAVELEIEARVGSRIGIEGQYRIEALQEEHAAYREVVAGKLQALRDEKEALQREVYRREDEYHGLEGKVRRLEARFGLGLKL